MSKALEFNRWRNPHAVSFSAAVPDFLAGRDTPRAFLDRCLSRIAGRDGEVKAFIRVATDSARAAADASTARYAAGKPLSSVDGLPIGIKDIMDTADMPTEMGSPTFTGWQPAADAACVQALRAGGAVIVGKTATTAFATGGPCATTNPFDARRTPGGSSSGTGAAVGAGMLPVGLGTQTQGSTLRPASYNGAVGIKPTHGTLSMQGVHPISITHDHLGVIAGSLEDAWRVTSHLSLTHGSPGHPFLTGASAGLPAARAPKKLVCLRTSRWEAETDDATRKAFDGLLDALRSAGVTITDRQSDASVAAFEQELEGEFTQTALDITAYEMKWPYAQYCARHGAAIEERIHERIARAYAITPAEYEHAIAVKRAMQQRAQTYAADADGFIMLSSSGPAQIGLQHTGSRMFLTHATFLQFPAMSLPMLESDGMPLGVQVIGMPHADGRLCEIAAWMMGC